MLQKLPPPTPASGGHYEEKPSPRGDITHYAIATQSLRRYNEQKSSAKLSFMPWLLAREETVAQ